MPKPRLVYVDAMSHSDKFFEVGTTGLLERSSGKIDKLVEHAQRSNIVLKVFIDAYIESTEAIQKRRGVEWNGVLDHIMLIKVRLSIFGWYGTDRGNKWICVLDKLHSSPGRDNMYGIHIFCSNRMSITHSTPQRGILRFTA